MSLDPQSPASQPPSPPKTPSQPKKQLFSWHRINKDLKDFDFRSSASLNAATSGTHDTPIKKGTHRTIEEDRTVKEMKVVLKEELQGGLIEAHDGYLETIFQSTELELRIGNFFQTSTQLFDNGRWCGIPDAPTREEQLYAPFFKLIHGIFSYFDYPHNGRAICETHQFWIPHIDGGNTAPDLMVVGTGSNFLLIEDDEDFTEKPSYRGCAAIIEIKIEKQKSKHSEHLLQVSSYARYCFVQFHLLFFSQRLLDSVLSSSKIENSYTLSS